jgi:DNA-binding SARP family transcriptional activator
MRENGAGISGNSDCAFHPGPVPWFRRGNREAVKLLQISLLGDLEVLREGRRLELPASRKARALLAYLVATGRPHRRERLTQLLWDVADDQRGALRWCLSKLRPLLDDPDHIRLIADRLDVVFEAGGAEIDLELVRETASRGVDRLPIEVLERAATRFRGEFLEGLELADFHAFQAWLVAMRQETRTLRMRILGALVARLDDTPEAAIPHALALVECDPLDEGGRSLLARLLDRAGRRHEAAEQLDAGRTLRRELTGAGSEVLDAAAQRLVAAADAFGAAAARTHDESAYDLHPAVVDRSPALVGREMEREALLRALEEVATARREHVVLLRGEPGIGKSRLLAEVGAAAKSRGGTVLDGRAYEAETHRPYGPWIDALAQLHPSTVGGTLASVLAPVLSGGGGDGEESSRERFYAAVVELVAARAHSRPPVVLLVDDAHWCDASSVELLHYVVRMCRHRPLLVLLAARAGELPDNEPMLRLLRGLRREGGLEEIDLGPLDRDATRALARAVSPHLDPERILAESAGNPLYTIELARAAGERTDTLPGAASERTDTLPRSLARLVQDRIAQLPAGPAEVLRWAAVLGTAFSAELLAAGAGLDEGALAEVFRILERHGLVRARTGGQGMSYLFVHQLVRRAVYDDISEPLRRLMHRRVAEILRARADSIPAFATEVVRHAVLGGDDVGAARACVAAGRHCLRVFASTEAYAMARQGLQHSSALEDPERTRLEIEAHDVWLAARIPEDRDGEARALEALAERALELGLVEHARLGFHLVSYLRWEKGDWADAERQMLRAERVARAGGGGEQVVAMAETARCLAMLQRDLPLAEAMVLEARSRARRAGTESMAIPDALGMLRFHAGAWDEAADLFQQARDLGRRDGDRLGEFQALEHWVVLELERGRADVALKLCEDLRAIAAKVREGSEAPAARALSALAATQAGEAPEGELVVALDALRQADAKHRLALVLNRAAVLDLARGAAERAAERAAEALQLAELLQHPTERLMAHVVLAQVARAQGEAERESHHLAALRAAPMHGVAAHAQRAASRLLESGPAEGRRSRHGARTR